MPLPRGPFLLLGCSKGMADMNTGKQAASKRPMGRRTFMGSVATAAVGSAAVTASKMPHDPARTHQRDFRPTGTLRSLSPNLFVYEDCANVYIVKQGSRAALINFGTGDVLGRLREIGVEKVERVFATHHHRDQVQGLADLKSYDFPVAVPQREARYFDAVEDRKSVV